MKIRPDLSLADIYGIDAEFLKSKGIRGIGFDIDNTLEAYSTAQPGERSSAFLRSLIEQGLQVGLVSNASRKRIERFASGFPEDIAGRIHVVYKAAKPLKKGFREMAGLMELADCSELAFCGDQLFTDILGARRSGALAILVEPIKLSAEPPFVRFKRRLEKLFK